MSDASSVPAARQLQGWDDSTKPAAYVNSDEPESPSNMAESPKKRKRSRKSDTEKKFECKHDGCGKSYSRAEHLYRHQLNHNPKHIYRCKFPNCTRAFVRQDLCIRHQERHNTHGSQLQKRDSFAAHSARNVAAAPPAPTDDQAAATPVSTDSSISPQATNPQYPQSPTKPTNPTLTTIPNYATISSAPLPEPSYAAVLDLQRKHSDQSGVYSMGPAPRQSISIYDPQQRHSYNAFSNTPYQNAPFAATNIPSAAPRASTNVGTRHLSVVTPASQHNAYLSPPHTINGASPASAFIAQQNIQVSPLTAHGFSDARVGAATTTSIASAMSGLGSIDPVSGTTISELDSMGAYALPVFGGETLNRSPFAMTDDFTAWLFNEQNSASVGYSSMPSIMPNFSDPLGSQLQNFYYPSESAFASYYSNALQQQQQQQQQHPMSVTSILDTAPPQSIISEEKRNEILDLIQTHFNEADQAATKKRKESLMEGDKDADNHVLSLRMMQTYVGSYWFHCHDQLPIIHKPTFSPNKVPNLLLLAVMALGAATLEIEQDSAAEFANFIALHLRWEIFRDPDFPPPCRLWIFQTLLLLETYEKMFSTRALHERAHIHHDTTLTLMRRGSSLINTSASDSPPSPPQTSQKAGTASGTASTSESMSAEESWARWIKSEATRRVAFAAFVLDTIHATMFGHSAKMVAHELRLPLPCDEALWSATSAGEVARVQSSLTSNGIKPTLFLDGLKKTLNGQSVRTNSFGRSIIMAGLLSVSWHMNQRDLQVTSLGVSQTLGARDKWRSALLRAFDHWKRDFDEAISTSNQSLDRHGYAHGATVNENVYFESRTVLHHLSHMASHVDIVDCQIYAGASRLLGRSITRRDYDSAREKMTDRWATKASARDATFYALKFLCQVLIPERNQSSRSHLGFVGQTEYSARTDFLLNRPWVLYFSALVVWCYGYALDGPIGPSAPHLTTPQSQREDMYAFLDRVGGVRTPNDLEKVQHRNQCLGLLLVLQQTFSTTRWELLHEAARLLGRCIDHLRAPTTTAGPR